MWNGTNVGLIMNNTSLYIYILNTTYNWLILPYHIHHIHHNYTSYASYTSYRIKNTCNIHTYREREIHTVCVCIPVFPFPFPATASVVAVKPFGRTTRGLEEPISTEECLVLRCLNNLRKNAVRDTRFAWKQSSFWRSKLGGLDLEEKDVNLTNTLSLSIMKYQQIWRNAISHISSNIMNHHSDSDTASWTIMALSKKCSSS